MEIKDRLAISFCTILDVSKLCLALFIVCNLKPEFFRCHAEKALRSSYHEGHNLGTEHCTGMNRLNIQLLDCGTHTRTLHKPAVRASQAAWQSNVNQMINNSLSFKLNWKWQVSVRSVSHFPLCQPLRVSVAARGLASTCLQYNQSYVAGVETSAPPSLHNCI